MRIKTVEELVGFKNRFKEASIHMMIHIILWAIITFAILFFLNNNVICVILGISSVIVFVFMMTRKIENEQLIIYSWICLACVVLCGVTVGKFVSAETILPVIIGVSVVDVFSFTPFGKKTVNAKLMNSNKWLSRLLVYGRSFETGKPVATKGFGDYLWYSITLAAIFTTYGNVAGIYAIITIIIGVVVNLIVINQIYKYTWYKGFPATIIPLGLCTILMVIIAV